MGHALWSCEGARDVWRQGSKKIQKMAFHNTSFLDIWSRLCNILQQKELEEAAIVARMIWYKRNDFIHGKKFEHPTFILNKAKESWQAFKHAQVPNKPPQQQVA